MEYEFFDVSEMDNKRFNTKRGVVRFRKAHIALDCVITLFTSPISHAHLTWFSNPSKLLYKMKVVELTKLCNFFAVSIII